jgi:hypothetical protein
LEEVLKHFKMAMMVELTDINEAVVLKTFLLLVIEDG